MTSVLFLPVQSFAVCNINVIIRNTARFSGCIDESIFL